MAGFWLCYYPDWSLIAVFPENQELEARRYANNHQTLCEFRPWGEVR